jgi:thiamine pyrophosphokinase
MKALIVTGGSVNRLFLKEEIYKNEFDLIVGVDRGAESLYELNIMPSILIGDFDSLSKEYIEYYKNEKVHILKYPKEKDMTDTEIAFDYVIGKHIDNIVVIGGTGSRLDHTLANIHILEKYDANIEIIDPNNRINVVKDNSDLILDNMIYKYVSLIPLSKKVSGVTTDGLKYELKNCTLCRDSSLSVSNEMIRDKCSIRIKEGTMAIIKSKD